MNYLFHILMREQEIPIPWIVHFVLIFLALWILYILFNLTEGYVSSLLNRPLWRHLRVYKKLNSSQIQILKTDFSFYNKLSPKHQRQFEHRVSHFLSQKQFHGREGLVVSEKIKLLVAAIGCMLSFGRKNYIYHLVQNILIYPKEFYSNGNEKYHQGEFNPRLKVLALSQKHFEMGYEITNDNLNLGIHEFMHAMQMEAKVVKDSDAARFNKYFKKIILQLRDTDTKDRLEKTRFFRTYAFTNQYEFTAVLAEYFFESPQDLKAQFPLLYEDVKIMLNFNFAGY